ncbi:alpha/beta hydrolase fold-domain-containing protein [Chlamydoabsidia padenii]|nr:alpha/beta hydrolase fold-domain-containing protein [Chlamydoabsidia padenii]
MTNDKLYPQPVYKAAFEATKSTGIHLHDEDYQRTRVIMDSSGAPDELLPPTIVEEKVIQAGVNNTSSVTLTIVRPVGSENETLPGLIFFHGGGWVLGSFKSHEKLVKDLAVQAHVAVVFVDYSLSPEVRFPVAVEECYSSTLWVHENAASIKVDPTKLAVAGDSAGGNLSAVISILLKQRGHGDVVKGQVLLYPVTAQRRDHYESYQTYGDGDYLLSVKDMIFFMEAYIGSSEVPNDVRVAPLLANEEELKGLPPALVLTAECDVLRDEGEEYARKLTFAGVDTCCVRVIGTSHGWAIIPIETSQYRQTIALIKSFLTKDAYGL